MRAKVVSFRDLRRAVNTSDVTRAELCEAKLARPRRRGDCAGGLRPCPWLGCRHHLALEEREGALRFPFGDEDVDLDALPDTCSLDVAERGGITLEEAGKRMHVTREQIRQWEEKGLRRLKLLVTLRRYAED